MTFKGDPMRHRPIGLHSGTLVAHARVIHSG